MSKPTIEEIQNALDALRTEDIRSSGYSHLNTLDDALTELGKLRENIQWYDDKLKEFRKENEELLTKLNNIRRALKTLKSIEEE